MSDPRPASPSRITPFQRGELQAEPIQPGDADELFTLLNQHRAALRPFLPWIDQLTQPSDQQRAIEHALTLYQADCGLTLCLRQQQRICGIIELHSVAPRHQHANLGYWIAPPWWGQGIASRMLAIFCQAAFRQAHLHRLEIQVAEENRASRRLAQRLGFQQEGKRRQALWSPAHQRHLDIVLYGLLAHEARPF